MNIRHFFKILPDDKFWLLSASAGLIAIHLTLTERMGHQELFSSSILYWLAVVSLVWSKHAKLELKGDLIGTIGGLSLIAIVLIKSQALADFDFFLRLFPLLSAIGLGLIASGINQLKQYWQEILILSILVPHSGLLSQLFDTSKITAQLATTILLYLGFDVSRQGVYVILQSGSVEVNPGCSGYNIMLQLLGASVIFIMMFPTDRWQRFLFPIGSVLFGFIMNGIRVAIMAVLAAASNTEAFDYWHTGNGSLLFSGVSVAILGLVCFLTMRQGQTAVIR